MDQLTFGAIKMKNKWENAHDFAITTISFNLFQKINFNEK